MKAVKLTVLALSTLLVVAFIVSQRGFALGGPQNTSYVVGTFTPVNGTINVTAGNTYEYSLTSEDKTYRWVGLWGNLSGSIELKTSTNSFKTWTISSATAGSVIYATTNINGIDPTDFGNVSIADLQATDGAYGFAAGLTDNIENTYIGYAQDNFKSPSMDIPISVNSSQTDASIWTSYLIQRDATAITTTDHVVWAVVVSPTQVGHNGQLMDYEILLPENEEAGDGEGIQTRYYLWVEFD